MRKIESGWVLPTKIKGEAIRKVTMGFDPHFDQAVEMMAKLESDRTSAKISKPTILMNLATRDSNTLRQKRKELRELYIQLKTGDRDDGRTGEAGIRDGR